MGELNFEGQSDIEPIDRENIAHKAEEQSVDDAQIETTSPVSEQPEQMGVTLIEEALIPDYYDDRDDALCKVYQVNG